MTPIITTLGRLESQTTLLNLPEDVRRDTILVVQDHEWPAHVERWKTQCREVVALPKHIDNLGPTRQWLREEFSTQKVVLLDDDLTFYVRPDPDDWHLKAPTAEQVSSMFHEIEARLSIYAHVGVSGREGNNRILGYGSECTRYMRILGYNYAMFPPTIQCGRINGMSDFDTNLQLLRAGLPSYVFSRYAQGQTGTQTAGGCSLNRTHETHTAEVHAMVAMHPGLVRATVKQNKTGGAFGTRMEVVVSWKQALGRDTRRDTSA